MGSLAVSEAVYVVLWLIEKVRLAIGIMMSCPGLILAALRLVWAHVWALVGNLLVHRGEDEIEERVNRLEGRTDAFAAKVKEFTSSGREDGDQLRLRQGRAKAELKAQMEVASRFWSATFSYLLWNLCDLSIIALGIWAYTKHPAVFCDAEWWPATLSWSEVVIPIVLLFLTALAAYLNYIRQPYLWHRHLVLLSRVDGSGG